jgi:hypothetical protein
MRSIAAFTLITLWMFGVVSGRTLGGLVHLLALCAVMIVFMSRDREPRSVHRR